MAAGADVFTNGTTPAIPVAGKTKLWIDTNGIVMSTDAAGNSTPISNFYLGTTTGTNTLAAGSATSLAYVTGAAYTFKMGVAPNTGATTLNVNGMGAKSIFSISTVAALTGGELKANAVYHVVYDGTQFTLLNPSVILSASVKGITDGSSATSGYVGETISSVFSLAAASFPADGAFHQLTSISLTTGDWLVTAWLIHNGSGTTTLVKFNVQTTSASNGTDGTNQSALTVDAVTGQGGNSLTINLKPGTTTTYYVNGRCFGAASDIFGTIVALRIR